jgi:uncharacterized protein (TIGR02996 family)
MTTDELAFRRAICASPDDDLPRLVYADWLDEQPATERCPNGPCLSGWVMRADGRMGADQCRTCDGKGTTPTRYAERAEFIRVQIELASMTAKGDWMNRQSDLELRELELWGLLNQQLMPHELHSWLFGNDAVIMQPTRVYNANAAIEFSRGFVSTLRGPLAAFWGDEECGRCKGSGDDPEFRSFGCARCCDSPKIKSGTGRVSGPTAALVELAGREPVTRVEFTDRSPNVQLGGYCWNRPSEYITDNGSQIPESLWNRLAPGLTIRTMGFDLTDAYRGYKDEAAARQALSKAILDAAREAAATPKE